MILYILRKNEEESRVVRLSKNVETITALLSKPDSINCPLNFESGFKFCLLLPGTLTRMLSCYVGFTRLALAITSKPPQTFGGPIITIHTFESALVFSDQTSKFPLICVKKPALVQIAVSACKPKQTKPNAITPLHL